MAGAVWKNILDIRVITGKIGNFAADALENITLTIALTRLGVAGSIGCCTTIGRIEIHRQGIIASGKDTLAISTGATGWAFTKASGIVAEAVLIATIRREECDSIAIKTRGYVLVAEASFEKVGIANALSSLFGTSAVILATTNG